ncbi:FH2 domain-containing protein 1-like [Hippocampus zosterae]|uniref:FH2 domain-containing protein 1-like n=1 Tax=Hippocampus zosterae TaxID=109293 RepID=UPI00223E01AC|nr:FH2 domain-containing protein 1-like [Hippocampus zosterae]XP_051934373.1 FH2 domain-containing protein 1-like [Hippocampus zosterae]
MEAGDPPPPPPPPPPLLPPPPPPPPPPPAPGQGGLKLERRRSRMRNFNWETIPKHTVMGKRNIWTEDATDGDYELDTEHMEELFSHKRAQRRNQQLQQLATLGRRGALAPASGAEVVSILSAKRSMNIGIFLKQFRRPVMDMIGEIQAGHGLGFGPGKLRELRKLLPDDDEVKELLKFSGDQTSLPDADLFMLMLIHIPGYEERLSCLVLKEEFFPSMAEMREFIGTLKAAGNELLDCDSLHSVIRLVLKTGNYMNAGGYAGSAVGFRMASLLKLADTKANKPGMNLMHYVVMATQNIDVELLGFPKQLAHIKAAARIHQSDLEADFDRQRQKVNAAKVNSLKQEDLKVQMEDFLKDAETCLDQVEQDLRELQSTSDSVAAYFCEDPSKFRLEECCSIFDSFCNRFLRAVQENTAREVAEVKRRHRNRLQSAAKRRSTATCSVRDKEMEGIALESILQNVLSNRLQRRRSGRPSSVHGSPLSATPQTGSLSEISSQPNLPELKRVGSLKADAMAEKEWNSAAELGATSRQREKSSDKDTDAAAEKAKGEETLCAVEDSSSRTPSVSSSARTFSAATDSDVDDIQDNNEEEAQKLREASKKVLLYQSNRGSVSSAEFSVENPKTRVTLTRQRTFDMETDRYPGDPTNEDLVRFLLSSAPSSKPSIPRRHTLPVKVKRDEVEGEEDDDLWAPIAGPRDTPQKTARKSKQAFDFPDLPQKRDSRSTETGLSLAPPVSRDEEPSHDENGQSVPPESSWSKSEAPGRSDGIFKHLDDIESKETSRQCLGTAV